MFANRLDQALIARVLEKARSSPRRRANYCFHGPEDHLQRMINAVIRGSYFAPHRHRSPDKLEIFTILQGTVAVITFDDSGEITDAVFLVAGGDPLQVEIPPGAWHTLAALSPEAVLYEVIDGAYDPATHKRFAPWAPPESDEAAGQAYLADLLRRLEPLRLEPLKPFKPLEPGR